MFFKKQKSKYTIRDILNKMAKVLDSVQTQEQFLTAAGYIGLANRRLNRYVENTSWFSTDDSRSDDISCFGIAGASMTLKRRYEKLSMRFLGYIHSLTPTHHKEGDSHA